MTGRQSTPTFLAGERLPLGQAPAIVLEAVAELLGSPIAHIDDAVGGMAASPAAVVTSRTGRRLFVKACGARINPDTFRLYEAEVPVAEALAGLPHIPALVGTRRVEVDRPDGVEPWVLLAFAAVDGACVSTPWSDADLRAVFDAWGRTRQALWDRQGSWGRQVSLADGELPGLLGRWATIAADPDDPWHPWGADWAARERVLLDRLRAPGRPAHLDLRADNVLRDRNGTVWFVDWSHLQVSPPWTDPAVLLVDVVASRRSLDLPAWVHRHEILDDAPPGALETLVAGVAAFMHRGRNDVRPELPWNPRWKRAMASALEGFVTQHRPQR